jgi:hypothetical protein
MFCLTLTEIPDDGGPSKQLGEIQFRQDRVDANADMASYSLYSQGHYVGQVAGWRQWYGAWRLAQTALNVIYGSIELLPDPKFRNDGRCNAVSKTRGKRCALKALPGGFFCDVHDRLQRT